MPISEIDVLRTVSLLGECRAHEIQVRLTGKRGSEAQFGTIFTYLDRLTQSGDVIYRIGDPVPERGHRRPRLYRATEAGRTRLIEAAAHTHAAQARNPQTTWAKPQT